MDGFPKVNFKDRQFFSIPLKQIQYFVNITICTEIYQPHCLIILSAKIMIYWHKGLFKQIII